MKKEVNRGWMEERTGRTERCGGGTVKGLEEQGRNWKGGNLGEKMEGVE